MIKNVKKRYLKLIEADTFEQAIHKVNDFVRKTGATILNYQDLGDTYKEVDDLHVQRHSMLIFYEISED